MSVAQACKNKTLLYVQLRRRIWERGRKHATARGWWRIIKKSSGQEIEKQQQGDQMNPWLHNNGRKELILIFLF